MTRHTVEWGLWVAGVAEGTPLKDWPAPVRQAQEAAIAAGLARFPGARVLEDHVEARVIAKVGRTGLYRRVTIEV